MPSNTTTREQYTWNAIIFILFPIAVVALFLLAEKWGALRQLGGITFLDMSILGLATYRLMRLVTFDKIFSFARAMFMDTRPDGSMAKPAKGFRLAIAELMECVWCTGVWAALATFVLYLLSPIGRFFVLILAVAALGTVLQVISRSVASSHSGPHTCG